MPTLRSPRCMPWDCVWSNLSASLVCLRWFSTLFTTLLWEISCVELIHHLVALPGQASLAQSYRWCWRHFVMSPPPFHSCSEATRQHKKKQLSTGSTDQAWESVSCMWLRWECLFLIILQDLVHSSYSVMLVCNYWLTCLPLLEN